MLTSILQAVCRADALMVAAEAAGEIVKRVNLGGTDAVTYEGVRDAILAALKPFTYDESQTERTWQPIETAPRDGREVLLLVEKRAGMPWCVLVGHWMPDGHCIEDHPPIDRG